MQNILFASLSLKLHFTIIGTLLCLLPLTTLAQVSTGDAKAAWQPKAGDRVMVDTDQSIVYLVHEDGTWLGLDGLTGQHRNVSYIGRYYFAATPTGTFMVKSVEEKGRSTTFGEGRFLRLFEQKEGGDERTAYGFHSHRQFQQMLDDKAAKNAWDTTGKGHRSYGCILLSEEDLTLVVATLEANDGLLAIETAPGLTPPPMATAERPSWFGW